MKPSKAATGLAGLGLAYGLWRNWGRSLDRLWERAFGPPDPGLVDFGTFRRSKNRNDALASPSGFCANARADILSPDFPVPAERLRAIVGEVAASEPNTERVVSDPKQEHDRYVARSRLFRFPDTIDVRIVGRGEGHSTLAVYSRSKLGRYDFGVNRRRIERWLKGIGEIAKGRVSGG